MITAQTRNPTRAALARARLDGKAKPVGALGTLEDIALTLACLQDSDQIRIKKPTMVVFAADHGVALEGVSIAPQSLTVGLVHILLAGRAGVSCICASVGMDVVVVDAGLAQPVEHPNLVVQRLGSGTANLADGPAMSAEQCAQGLALGGALVRQQIAKGCTVIGFGEVGIGNTTAAAALMAALMDLPAEQCVGAGTGINPDQQRHKQALVERALRRVAGQGFGPQRLLQELGGFEIAQMVGGMVAAAESGIAILVDGFIATAAAMVAQALVPDSRACMIFGHCSDEQGHKRMLEGLQARPLLDLGLRLGEGTGAALALPLLRAAAQVYNDMISLDEMGVHL